MKTLKEIIDAAEILLIRLRHGSVSKQGLDIGLGTILFDLRKMAEMPVELKSDPVAIHHALKEQARRKTVRVKQSVLP